MMLSTLLLRSYSESSESGTDNTNIKKFRLVLRVQSLVGKTSDNKMDKS